MLLLAPIESHHYCQYQKRMKGHHHLSFLIDLRHIPSDNSPTSPTKSFEKDFLNWEEQKLQR